MIFVNNIDFHRLSSTSRLLVEEAEERLAVYKVIYNVLFRLYRIGKSILALRGCSRKIVHISYHAAFRFSSDSSRKQLKASLT
jgi:hypothetical protein